RRGRRIGITRLVVFVRRARKRGPLLCVHFVMRHSGYIELDELVRRGRPERHGLRHLEPGALRCLHAEQEAKLPSHFVEQIVDSILALGNRGPTIGERHGLVAENAARTLIVVEQRPDADARGDYILAVIARVVPAARDVERVIASRPAIASLILLVEALDDLRRVPGGTCPLRILHVLRVDRDAAAVVIKVDKRVVSELSEQVLLDRERSTGLAADDQTIARARRADAAEVNVMNVLSGTYVDAENGRLAGRDFRAVGIDESPIERRGAIALHDRSLRPLGLEAELIESDIRQIGMIAPGERTARRDSRPHQGGYNSSHPLSSFVVFRNDSA